MWATAHQSGHIFSWVPLERHAGGWGEGGGGGGRGRGGRSAGPVGINSDVSHSPASPNRSIRGSAETAACQWEQAVESRTRSRAASSNTPQELPPSIYPDCDLVGGPGRVGGTECGGREKDLAQDPCLIRLQPEGGIHPDQPSGEWMSTWPSQQGEEEEASHRRHGRGEKPHFHQHFSGHPNSIISQAKMLRPHSFFFFTTSLQRFGVP